MFRKYCPRCKEYSYSASEREWICPTCSNDLTDEPVLTIYEKSAKEVEE